MTEKTSQLFDVHTHTQFAAYADDQDAVIRRALDTGIWMVNVGTQRDTSAAAIATARRYERGVFATVGLHPIHTSASYHDKHELGADDGGFISRGEAFDYAHYKKLAEDSKVVAIGECGLDYYRLEEKTKEIQYSAFEQQITLAHDVQKPLMIHCRNAFADLIDVLTARQSDLLTRRGIIHFFAGSVADARRLLDLGFSFSFGGVITFARDYDTVVRYIPIERIVLETDAPYITPVPHRGRRNEPAYVTETARKLGEIKTLSYEEICVRTTMNAQTLFSINNAI
ncbi:MAG: TatD family hydrolase [Patescibacteria group bacterium]